MLLLRSAEAKVVQKNLLRVGVSVSVMKTHLFVKTVSACVNLTAASEITESLIIVSDAAAEVIQVQLLQI